MFIRVHPRRKGFSFLPSASLATLFPALASNRAGAFIKQPKENHACESRAVPSTRSSGETDAGQRAGSAPARSTEDLQPRRSLFRLPRPDRLPNTSDAPRMDWLQAIIVAGGAAIVAYHLGFLRGRAEQADSAKD
ncbi:MAG TPA: hypothetical protein VNK82_02975 [Terriglobales bacterium]|nr:hypothetical protein [Terriglobales bacterium]